MVDNRSAPEGFVVPTLVYRDVGAAITWLCDVFEFSLRLQANDPSGRTTHAQLSVGGGSVILSAARQGQSSDWSDPAEFRPPRVNEVSHVVSVRVTDVDGHHEHARERGARILHQPTNYPFGERQYSVEDLEGHRWSFTQSVADVAPGEWGASRPAASDQRR